MSKHGIIDLKITNSSNIPDNGYVRVKSSTNGIQIIKNNGSIEYICSPWELPVISNIINDPSTLTPSDNDRYIVPINAVGLWLGHDNDIAQWVYNEWIFFNPLESRVCYSNEAGALLLYDGSIWKNIGGEPPVLNTNIETFIIDSTIISNSYIDLLETPRTMFTVNWNGSILFEGVGEDYTVNNNRVTFLPLNGGLELLDGMKIQIKYEY